MGRLVASDQPGGSEFVDELKRIWDRGDAAFPVDLRLPAAAHVRRQPLSNGNPLQ